MSTESEIWLTRVQDGPNLLDVIDVVSRDMLGEISDSDPAAFGVDTGPLPFLRSQSFQHADIRLA